MPPTTYPYINDLLAGLLSDMQTILGNRLVGLYLYGSLVMGDFDTSISDIDLLAATAADIDQADFDALKRMQDAVVARDNQWDNRLEIAYLSVHALQTYKEQASQIAIISPGEPFHFKEAGQDWVINWYIVREQGVTLFGPPPSTIIAPASKEEFLQTVKDHAIWWREWVDDMRHRPGQAYVILTMCRALYTCTHGQQVSKLKAAAWAETQMPEWSPLIQKALKWRKGFREPDVDDAATLPDTRRFVYAVIDRIFN